MESINFILYSLLSVLNGFLCVYAIIRMYDYFRPEIELPRFMRIVISGWVACLLMLGILQLNVIVKGDLGYDWTSKLFGSVFAWVSLKFARISQYIKHSTEA